MAWGQYTVLVQVPSSRVQIEAALSVGDTKTADVFKRADQQIKTALIKDFRTNYAAGAVYFFEPEDAEHVINKRFDKVTFWDINKKEVPFTAPDNDTFYIANISFYPRETEVVSESGEEVVREQSDVESHLGLGIILRTADYEPVSGKLRFTACRIGKRGNIFDKSKRYYVFWGSAAFSRKLLKHGPQ